MIEAPGTIVGYLTAGLLVQLQTMGPGPGSARRTRLPPRQSRPLHQLYPSQQDIGPPMVTPRRHQLPITLPPLVQITSWLQ